MRFPIEQESRVDKWLCLTCGCELLFLFMLERARVRAAN